MVASFLSVFFGFPFGLFDTPQNLFICQEWRRLFFFTSFGCICYCRDAEKTKRALMY